MFYYLLFIKGPVIYRLGRWGRGVNGEFGAKQGEI